MRQFVMSGLNINSGGHLTVGGVSVPELAREYGTPLYILDEQVIRDNCREVIGGLREHYNAPFTVAFASKALCFKELYRILREEGMGADVVSGGELYTAVKGGFDPKGLYFHGNNKSASEIKYALESGVRRIVVDNAEELELLGEIAAQGGYTPDISFRIKPGIDAHTHEFIKTGKIDSKFGLALETGEAAEVIARAAKMKTVRVVGINCHIGSQIFGTEPFALAAKVMLTFMRDLRENLGVPLNELNLGGGFGIKYLPNHEPVTLADMSRMCAESVTAIANELNLPLPELVLEPGRSITAPAGLTVYTIGSVKHIPGVNTYVAVDGGMTDNPRHALYGASYEPIMPERPNAPATQNVIIAGRLCESGDIITRNAPLPDVKTGDLLGIQATGAYNFSMASNYNRVPRPPIVIVYKGKSRIAVRRQTYEDLLVCDQ
ncbi:MAG: diaminopimelate decarboxylase [Oscillospiraceae bacterium]|nr:diaminopimelate decarboxylase [Oscillospiraceae bacterium]